MRVLCWVHDQAFEWGRLRGAIYLCDKTMLMLQKHSVRRGWMTSELSKRRTERELNVPIVTQGLSPHPYLICPAPT